MEAVPAAVARPRRWQRRRPRAWLSAAALVLAAAVAGVGAAAGGGAAARVAVATVIRGEDDVLPARVLLRSAALHAAALPRVAYAMPGAVSLVAARQLAADGVDVVRLGRGAGAAAGMTYTRLFGETQYDRLVYLAPEMLVKEDVSPLARCPVLCAAFLRPCSFATGVMVISPNATLYREIVARWPPAACGGAGGNSDGLDDEACGLNELFGARLMNAPLFDVGDGGPPSSDGAGAPAPRGRGAAPAPDTPMRRLPMGCHTPHILFYPRLRFEVPKESCGVMRVVDYASPAALQPWRWWTYGLLNLSWDWLGYRVQLADPNPPGSVTRAGVWLRIVACAVTGVVALVLWSPRLPEQPAPPAAAWPPASRRGAAGCVGVLQEPVFLVVAVAAGAAFWLLSAVVAAAWTPRTLMPFDAFALFGTYKTIVFCALLLAHGRLFCATQALPSDSAPAAPAGGGPWEARTPPPPPPTSARVVASTFLYSAADVAAMAVVVLALNAAPFGSIYAKLAAVVPCAALYAAGLLAGLARLSMLWLAWGAAGADGGYVRQAQAAPRDWDGEAGEVGGDVSPHDD